ARAAGATVVSYARSKGKGAAMATGAAYAVDLRVADNALLFVDADLESSAAGVAPLVAAVMQDDVDLAIGTLPADRPRAGRGLVVSLAQREVHRRTGWLPTQPLSGQRCIRRGLFEKLLPLARGFGVETRMSIDA